MASPKTPMSAEHKEALKTGREQGRIVREYLEAMEANKPKRGRKRTADSIQKQLDGIESKLAEVDALTRLQLLQERRDLQAELTSKSGEIDMTALEDAFVRVAAEYGRRKGISYAVWREIGVTADVLKRAGIGRGA